VKGFEFEAIWKQIDADMKADRLDAVSAPTLGVPHGVIASVRDAVLANISHEFRTPLSAQLASIELLIDQLAQVAAEERRRLSVVHDAGDLDLVHGVHHCGRRAVLTEHLTYPAHLGLAESHAAVLNGHVRTEELLRPQGRE